MDQAYDLTRWWCELREARLRDERGPDWENEENYADARENDVERFSCQRIVDKASKMRPAMTAFTTHPFRSEHRVCHAV